ncbi:MAG: GNAT family N-acetyltransferase [Saprospiraceae bacterium]|nr:GNAT family N-acetyltransferase [Saprospiraceae bacterium]
MKKFLVHAHESVEYWELVALRDEILRKPLGLVFTVEQLSAEADSWHIGGYENGLLKCCLILKPLAAGELKMRQVAVAEAAQQQGWGRAINAFSEQFAKEHGFTFISCHARESARIFYEKLGYAIVGDRFEEVGLPHFRMEKQLA